MKNAEPIILLSNGHVRSKLLLNLINLIEDLGDLIIDRHTSKK